MIKKTFYLFSYVILLSCSLWAADGSKDEAKAVVRGKLTPISDSTIFSYDTGMGTPGYLHARLEGRTAKGEAWSARFVDPSDIPFYQGLFNDGEVMAQFGDGQPRTPESTVDRITKQWLPRSAAGQPHSSLTIFDAKGERIGHVIAGGGDRAGTSEVAGLGIIGAWSQGYGESVFYSITEILVPEVWRIGRGLGLSKSDADAAIVKAFQCFGNQPLDQLDATSSPANVPSWKILLSRGFGPAKCGLDKDAEGIKLSAGDFAGKADNEIEDYRLMEEYVLRTYFDEKAPRLVAGKRYAFIDHRGRPWTLSKHARFNRLKFHLERTYKF